jgi:hypothetical protein
MGVSTRMVKPDGDEEEEGGGVGGRGGSVTGEATGGAGAAETAGLLGEGG